MAKHYSKAEQNIDKKNKDTLFALHFIPNFFMVFFFFLQVSIRSLTSVVLFDLHDSYSEYM